RRHGLRGLPARARGAGALRRDAGLARGGRRREAPLDAVAQVAVPLPDARGASPLCRGDPPGRRRRDREAHLAQSARERPARSRTPLQVGSELLPSRRGNRGRGERGGEDFVTERKHRGRQLVVEMRTRATPEQVYEAWADPEKIAHWFVDRAHGKAEVGSIFTWIFEKFGYEIPYEVVAAEPGRRFALGGEAPKSGPFLLEVT